MLFIVSFVLLCSWLIIHAIECRLSPLGTILRLFVPDEIELDEFRVALLNIVVIFAYSFHHIIVDNVSPGSGIGLVRKNDPCAAQVIILLLVALLPYVLEPEAGHAILLKRLFVLRTHWAGAGLESEATVVRFNRHRPSFLGRDS